MAMSSSVELPTLAASTPRNVDDGSSQRAIKDFPDTAGSRPPITKAFNDERNYAGKVSSPIDESKTSILYTTEYRDDRGRLHGTKSGGHPLEPPSQPLENVVLEIVSVLTVARRQDFSDDDTSKGNAAKKKIKTAVAVSDSEPGMLSKSITIHSEKVANALRAVIFYSPSHSFGGRPFHFDEPYKVLFHHFGELEAYRYKHPTQHSDDYKTECNKVIDLLLEVLGREKPEIAEEQKRYKRSPPVCTFDLLWLLFKPGEACYRTSETRQTSAYIVKDVTGGSLHGRPAPYRIYMWQFNFNGYHVGREVVKVVIAPFSGEKNIQDLECFPCRYHEDESTLRQRLVARGKKFWETTKDRPYVEHDGISQVYPYEAVRAFLDKSPNRLDGWKSHKLCAYLDLCLHQMLTML